MAASTATVTGLYVYPIKGCRGVAVPAACFTSTGLKFDRDWAIVKASADGKIITMRECHKLALVVPQLPADLFTQPRGAGEEAAVLTVKAPGMPTLTVPLSQPATQLKDVLVWEWTGKAADQGDAAAEWFTTYVGQPCRLVRYVGSKPTAEAPAGDGACVVRPTDPEFAQGYETSLSDGFPMLLASEDSLADLNARLAASDSPGACLAPLPINRFRPNIVVKGLQPWAEDHFRKVQVARAAGGEPVADLTSVKPCSRCKVPTIDPNTGVPSDGEPLDILAKFRSGSNLSYTIKSWKYAVHFGWNLVQAPEAVGQTIQVGDEARFSGAQKAW